MRIATWNVNGLRARLDFVLHWLRSRQPDLVGLQELKLTDENFPHREFEAAGYQTVCHGQKSWNGVAILSRKPIEAVQRGLPGQEDFGSRLISVDVDDLRFTTLYLPNGKHTEHEDFPRKLAWMETLAEHIREAHDPERPEVLCGDFNVCPEAIDSHDDRAGPEDIFHTPAERERFQKLLDWGFVDLFRKKFPHEKLYSWWDYRGGAFHRGLGLRIDFLLGTRPVVERLQSVEIDRDYRKKQDGLTASDHAPVIADLA
ncbi:MAG: exodeoxyribonuclease III [bacterium]|nr:exodeoxyribonuclease III [bacterium]